MGAQAEVRRIIGTCQARTASTTPPVSTACLTAQRRAARDDGEPSTPTTIFVLPADIRTRSFYSAVLYSQLLPPGLVKIGPFISIYHDQSGGRPGGRWRPIRDVSHRRGRLS